VRCVFTGTQALPASLYRKARTMFGPVVRITYGKTECVNPITVLEPEDVDQYFEAHAERAGACVGWPASGVEIRINPLRPAQSDSPGNAAHATNATRSSADAGSTHPSAQEAATDLGGVVPAEPESGEVWLRARHMSLGMIGADGFIAHEPDGWHRTGDLGYIDASGRLMLTGREADVIKTGGYRVNPDEIETLLQGIEGCGPVCVTSLASDYWGEVIIAVAEQAGDDWREQAIGRVACLSQHKRPRLHVAIDALPRNPQGKINRRQVSRLVLDTHVFIDGPYPRVEPR
jgi:acyl-CoA synthetase (AMP-forming)/AMP-acid ligase II